MDECLNHDIEWTKSYTWILQWYEIKKQIYKKAVNKYKRKNAEKILVQQKEYVKKTGVTKFALKTWSTVIKTLDNNMCKLCDSKKYLNSHHIMPMQYYPELALDVNNGITLCEECHHKLHGFAIY